MVKDMVDKKTAIVMTAILSLAALEIAALQAGINGTLFKIVIMVIAGLAGWTMPQPNFMK